MSSLRFQTFLALLFFAIPSCLFGEEQPEKESDTDEVVSFQADIKPILSDRCFKCHGPDEQKRDAELRLDIRDEAEYALSPGDIDESELVRRITSDDPEEQMPPPKSKLSLSEAEIEKLTRWVEQGAKYEQHWSFVPVNDVELPAIGENPWTRNEIDLFVLDRLQREKLTPQSDVSREKLIRRLYFDLIGLPPTIDEINAFVNDESEDAYEKLVDQLLAREEYGERMTSEWMDVARYSDTFGYQVDRDREVWPWRDWVISAFNRNLPYDDFVTWQLAGDLLPNATEEQILATTFNRLHSQKVEGGSVPEEFRVEYVADRNHTFGTAFLGLTLECCRCHDHKYDPITQKEYYQFFSFFNSIDEAGLYSYFTPSVPTPTLLLTNDDQKKQLSALEKVVHDESLKLKTFDQIVPDDLLNQWIAKTRDQLKEPNSNAAKPIVGLLEKLDFEKYQHAANKTVDGPSGKAVKLTGDDAVGLKVGNFHRSQSFSISLRMQTPDEKERAVVFHRSRAWTDAASRGYELLIDKGRLAFSLIHFWPGNAISIRTKEKIPIEEWLNVAVTYDGSSTAAGMQILINGVPADCEVVRDNLLKQITGGGGDNIAIGERFRDRGFTNGLVDDFQVYNRKHTRLEIAAIHSGRSVDGLICDPNTDRELLKEMYSQNEHRGKLLQSLTAARRKRDDYLDKLKEIMVMRELPEPRSSYLLGRGMYDNPKEQVFPDTPDWLPEFPANAPRNRLGLAMWLTSPENPLLSRVTVNRYWQMIFGNGLVRTTEDFGSQGTSPTHPELLDWLAKDLIDHGWDVKRLLKQMVMSSTYRQESATSADLLARDPDNLLLARAPSYRLTAEMIRDNALAVSGLLVQRIGGPSARPYEVAVSFKPVNKDKGQGLYRRSMYTYWKRTGPAPVMMTLNASKRDVCEVKRERTSTPLQAFVLMNDPQFVEAAKMLGQKLLKKNGAGNVDASLADAFQLLTSRSASAKEMQILQKLYRDQLAYFSDNQNAAEQFLKTGDALVDGSLPRGELAAISMTVSTLMNFDECVMKR